MQTLTDKHVGALFRGIEGSRHEALFWFAVTASLPEGEILGLKWSSLERGTGRLMIHRQIQRSKDRGVVFKDLKAQTGKRLGVLSRKTPAKLKGHRVIQQYERLFAGGDRMVANVIFPSTIGARADPRNFFGNYKICLRKAGLPDLPFQDLRHTAATLMLQQGMHPKVVQERLGHTDIALTLNTDSHVLPDIQQEAVQKMDRVLASKRANRRLEAPDQRADLGSIDLKSAHD